METLNSLFARSFFPVLLKYFTLVVFLLLIVIGFMASSDDPVILKQLRNTNLGNLLVWSYWWPVVTALSIFFGRIWCMVCPVELITSVAAKLGLRRKRPAWILSGWVITVFFIVILFIGIEGLAIHRNPIFMALYLLMILGVAILAGLIYKKNTFCRYICPVGYTLGLYAMLSSWGWRARKRSLCDSCPDKSCIHTRYLYNSNAKSCGVDLYPATVDDNKECILCGGCVKTCGRFNSTDEPGRPNPGMIKTGFASGLFRITPLRMAEFVFVLVVSGFVVTEVGAEWETTSRILNFLPSLSVKAIGVQNNILIGLVTSLFWFFLGPLMIWGIPYLVHRLSGGTMRVKDYLLSYGLAFIPIMAAGHLVKALLKTTSRIPYFQFAVDDLTGLTTARKIIDGTLHLAPTPSWLEYLLIFLMALIFMFGTALCVLLVRRLNSRNPDLTASWSFYMIPVIYGGLFLVMMVAWKVPF